MRNLKKLLAVVLTVCLLASVSIPAFAEELSEPEICEELGIIKGTGAGVTEEYLASQPDRLQGAIMYLRLRGLEDEAMAFTGTDNFSDIEGLSDTNKAILAYLKANPDLGFVGIGDNKFAPLDKMSAKEYYKVLLTALGYDYGTDFTWATVFSFAASKGLIKLVDNATFTVEDLCIGTVEALKLTVKGGTDTLIETLVDNGDVAVDKAVATGLYSTTVKALEVVSATADNLKTAKIVFNKELDSTTIKAANFSNSGVTADPILLADKKTVIVVFATAKTQSATADIVIENVKATDGVKIAKVTKTVTFVDTTIPVISGAVAKNAKTIVLSVNEPLNESYDVPQMWTNVKIDGVAMTADSSVSFKTNELTFNLTSLLAKGTHKIDISGLKDYAGYVAIATSFNVEVAEDTTAPAIISAKMNNVSEVEVTFSEDVDATYPGTFWVDGNEVTATQDADDKAVFTLAIPAGEELDIGAIVQVKVEYKGQKDVNGNEVTTKTAFIFQVADDTVLPTVAVTIASGNKLVLTFSKTMVTTAGKVTVYKKDGTSKLGDVSLSAAPAWKSSNTVKEINASDVGLANVDAQEIKVKVEGAKDATIRANALVATTTTLNALDTKDPTIADMYKITPHATDAAKDTITFYFSEAMDSATITNLSNYYVTTGGAGVYVAGKPFSAISDISSPVVASDAKSVTFTAKSISTAGSLGFTVYALKDLAANTLNGGVAATAAGETLQLNTVTATGTKTIKAEFSANIGSFDPSAYVVRAGNTTTSPWKAFVSTYAIDAKKVTLTLSTAIPTTTAALYLVPQNSDLVKDVYGWGLALVAPVAVIDNIAPTASIDSVTTGAIKITFSEEMVDVSLANDVIVREDGTLLAAGTDYTIGALAGDGKSIEITGLESGTEYTVEILSRAATDASPDNNALTDFAPKKITVD